MSGPTLACSQPPAALSEHCLNTAGLAFCWPASLFPALLLLFAQCHSPVHSSHCFAQNRVSLPLLLKVNGRTVWDISIQYAPRKRGTDDCSTVGGP